MSGEYASTRVRSSTLVDVFFAYHTDYRDFPWLSYDGVTESEWCTQDKKHLHGPTTDLVDFVRALPSIDRSLQSAKWLLKAGEKQ
jgi:hypothetical protein